MEKPILLQADSDNLSRLEKVSHPDVGGNGADGNKRTELIFDNLVWMTSAEAAQYLRKSVGALRVMVCRKQIRARKFHRRLYFKRPELDRLLDSSELKGGI